MQLALIIFCAVSPCIGFAHIDDLTFTHDQANGHKDWVEARNPETIGFTYLAFAASVACYQDSHVNENHYHEMTSVLTSEFGEKCKNMDQFKFKEFDHHDTEVLLLKNKDPNKKVAVFAFRGTDDIEDLIEKDASFVSGAAPVWSNWGGQFGSHDGDPKVYGGFLLGFNHLEATLKREIKALEKEHFRIVFTGHSLGGPFSYMAALLAHSLGVKKNKIHVIAFGSTKLFNLDLKRIYENTLGCANTIGYYNWNDLVTLLPPQKDFSRPCFREADQLGKTQSKTGLHIHVCKHLAGLIPFVGDFLKATCSYLGSPITEQLNLGHRTVVYTKTLDREFIPQQFGGGGTQVGHWPRKMCSTGKEEMKKMKKWNPEPKATQLRRRERRREESKKALLI